MALVSLKSGSPEQILTPASSSLFKKASKKEGWSVILAGSHSCRTTRDILPIWKDLEDRYRGISRCYDQFHAYNHRCYMQEKESRSLLCTLWKPGPRRSGRHWPTRRISSSPPIWRRGSKWPRILPTSSACPTEGCWSTRWTITSTTYSQRGPSGSQSFNIGHV